MNELPFSIRSQGPHEHIENDFPVSARIGLLHLLDELVEMQYVSGWIAVSRELQKIARVSPVDYGSISSSVVLSKAREDAQTILGELRWQKVFDFCERLFRHLACAKGTDWNNEFQEETPKTEVQAYIANELQRLFAEEQLAYEFSAGVVSRRGRKHSNEIASRAQVVLGDLRLKNARRHYSKAQDFFRDPLNPDFENVVKEAVCSVEAAGKALFPDAGAKTLSDLAKWFLNKKKDLIPPPLVRVMDALYAYRGGGEGVAHGGTNGAVVTSEVAEYVLSICASQIIYLVDVSKGDEPDLPF